MKITVQLMRQRADLKKMEICRLREILLNKKWTQEDIASGLLTTRVNTTIENLTTD